jgi:hypothetical protein
MKPGSPPTAPTVPSRRFHSPLADCPQSGCPVGPQAAPSPAVTPSRPTIAALYVGNPTVYECLGLDLWDITRDARGYCGPHPIIAHPPCGHWGTYHTVCQQPGRDCGPIAVDQARRWGGVVEQPARSRMFRWCGCPTVPRQRDMFGGLLLYVEQGYFGHPARKPTLLYVVGIERPRLLCRTPPGHRLLPVESLSPRARLATPLRFALFLLALASQVRR